MTRDSRPFEDALVAVERIVNREPEADEVLRMTVFELEQRIDRYLDVGISFLDAGQVEPGPRAGDAGRATEHLEVPIAYDGHRVGTLSVSSAARLGADDRAFLKRVAQLVSAHCLVGWDTGGVAWDEVG